MADSTLTVTLLIVIGTLAAIVYSLRILVLLERRIARIDKHIELLALDIMRDEKKELAAEERIEGMIQAAKKGRAPASAAKGKAARKKK
jgi:hypothetical protein